jgi:FtsH-binding integral membrane protein
MNTFTSMQIRHGAACALSAFSAWIALYLLIATTWGTLARSPWLGSLWLGATLVWSFSVIIMLRKKKGLKEWVIAIVGGIPCLILFPLLIASLCELLQYSKK